MNRYGTSIAIMVIALAGLVFGVVATASWSASAEDKVKQMDAAKKQAFVRDQLAQRKLVEANMARPAIKDFIKAWEPAVKPIARGKDFASGLMAVLERDALATGSGSSEKTLPAINDYRLGNRIQKVQKLSLTATGDLTHCLAWLGAIQEHLPYSRVEGFSLSGFGTAGAALRVTVAHPIPAEASPAPAAVASAKPVEPAN